jgi:hypothetical protein
MRDRGLPVFVSIATRAVGIGLLKIRTAGQLSS